MDFAPFFGEKMQKGIVYCCTMVTVFPGGGLQLVQTYYWQSENATFQA